MSRTKNPDEPALYWIIDTREPSQYTIDSYSTFQITCSLVTVEYDSTGTRRIRNLSSYSSDPRTNLKAVGRFWYGDRAKGEYRDGSWDFGFEQDYQLVNLDRAQKMVKVLGQYERARTRQNEQEGYATSFGEFVARAARAVGLEGFVWAADGSNRSGSYDEREWRIATIGGGRERIEFLGRQWFDAGQKKDLTLPGTDAA